MLHGFGGRSTPLTTLALEQVTAHQCFRLGEGSGYVRLRASAERPSRRRIDTVGPHPAVRFDAPRLDARSIGLGSDRLVAGNRLELGVERKTAFPPVVETHSPVADRPEPLASFSLDR